MCIYRTVCLRIQKQLGTPKAACTGEAACRHQSWERSKTLKVKPLLLWSIKEQQDRDAEQDEAFRASCVLQGLSKSGAAGVSSRVHIVQLENLLCMLSTIWEASTVLSTQVGRAQHDAKAGPEEEELKSQGDKGQGLY